MMIVVGCYDLSGKLSQACQNIYTVFDSELNFTSHSNVVENYLASEDVKLLVDAYDKLFVNNNYVK
jgi:hypothetical protein